MTTMIERVARALWAADKAPWDPIEFDALAPEIQEQALKVSRAAIAAMREPTEGMGEAGDGLSDLAPSWLRWEYMIDAALEEKP